MQFPKLVDTHREVDESTITIIPISFWSPKKSRLELLIKNDDEESEDKLGSIYVSGVLLGAPGAWLYPFPQKEEHRKRYDAHTQAQTLSEVGYTNIFPISTW